MADAVTDLAERAQALQPEDRSRLVDLLLASLHEPPTAEIESAWEVEIGQRLASYDRGEVTAVDAADVFAKAHSIAR